jgi:hypothetical protein
MQIVLFGSRARGEAVAESDWDVAVVVRNESGANRKAMRDARDLFADLALSDIADGFHLRPIVIPAAAGDGSDLDAWRVSPGVARNVKADGLLIA